MPDTVNGLPIGVFIALVGIGIVLLAWVLVRFGSKIAKFLLACAGVGIGAVVAISLATQSFANVQQSKATVEVAKVARMANSSNLLLVGAVGCVGGVAVVAVLVAAGIAAFLWYRLQLEQRQPVQRPQMMPQVVQPQIAPGYAGDFDLAWIQEENWVEQGEMIWEANDSLFW